MASESFKVCSICRTPIAYGAKYYLCNVSTCRSRRTGLFFCSLPCFEAHVPNLRHRDAWAEEERAPTRAEVEAEEAAQPEPAARPEPRTVARPEPQAAASATQEARRRIIGQEPAAPTPAQHEADDGEVLVVVSKLKKFVRERSGMNTSDGAMSVLSDHLRWLSVEALRKAAEDGRKTVMDRDYQAVIRALRQRP